jgi:hypothetical protein
MDLIATYHPFTITTTFLGLITAVWVGFRYKRAFSMVQVRPYLPQEYPSFVQVTRSFAQVHFPFAQVPFSFVQACPSFVQVQSHFVQVPFSFVQVCFTCTKELVTMPCNYGDRLALPI